MASEAASSELQDRLNKMRKKIGESAAGDVWKYEGAPPAAAPGVPEFVKARATKLTVKWEALPKPQATEAEKARGTRVPSGYVYKVEYGFPWMGGWNTVEKKIFKNEVTVKELTANTNYIFRVSARYAEAADDAWGPVSAKSAKMCTLTEEKQKELDDAKAAAMETSRKKSMIKSQEHAKAAADAAKTHETEALKAQLRMETAKREAAEKQAREAERLRRKAEAEARERAKQTAEMQRHIERLDKARAEVTQQAEAAAAREEHARIEAAQRTRQADELQAALRELAAQREADEKARAQQLEADAAKSDAERAKLEAEREALAKQAAEKEAALVRKLEEVEAERAKTEAEAAARLEEENKRMAEMHQHHKEEAERMAAAMQAKLGDMEAALGSVEAQKKELENATKKQLQEASQATQAEVAAREAEIEALQAEIAATQEAYASVKQMADASAQDAEVCTSTIVKQAEENERLRRLARYKDATIRSLQGAGPNVELESALVTKGHARENVRFFLEVLGDTDKARVENFLDRLKTLTAAGHPDDAVREALTVCTDDAMIESYLVEYEKRRKDYMGMPLDAAGDDDDAAHAAVPAGGV